MGLNSKILALALLSSVALAHDFSYCASRYEDNSIKIDDHIAVPIRYKNKTYYVSFSKTPIKTKNVILADDFIGLYSLKSPKDLRPYTLKPIDEFSATLEMASIGLDDKSALAISPGKVQSKQKSLLDYATFSKSVPLNGVISNICYQIYGLGVGNHGDFIDKEYLERFLSQAKDGKIYYGDIGIRLKGTNIYQVNPFFAKNPFRTGDKILKVNNKETPDFKSIQLAIANSKGVTQVEVMRKGEKITLSANAVERSGGFLSQDSFFEGIGIRIDRDLNILKNSYKGTNELSALQAGDHIKWIDGVDPRVTDGDIFSNIRNLLSNAYQKHGSVEMLVSRNGFEFKMQIDLKSGSKKKQNPGFILLEERTSRHK